MAPVPIVDISNPSATSLEALDAACSDHGFFLLEGHGRDDIVAEMWDATERFFDSPQGTRDAIRRRDDNPFGYNDRELTKRKRDHKQVFDYASPDGGAASLNRWPDESVTPSIAGFRVTMERFHRSFSGLAVETCALLHRVLGLSSEGAAQLVGDPRRSSVRLNHYPVGDPVPEADRRELAELGPTALGHHTDPGTLTLLLQDSTGGLQTEARNGEWIDVEPIPGTIVVNLADAVQVWTNDRYRAAVHRVVPMTTARRFSIPYFMNPPGGTIVEPIPELADAPRYRSFEWGEFIASRNADNFADIGAADAQISDYLITAD